MQLVARQTDIVPCVALEMKKFYCSKQLPEIAYMYVI